MANVAKKRLRNPIDRSKSQAVNWVAQNYSVTIQYVYAVVRGEREQDEIKRAYEKKYSEIKKVLAV